MAATVQTNHREIKVVRALVDGVQDTIDGLFPISLSDLIDDTGALSQVLTSNGPGTTPTMQTPAPGFDIASLTTDNDLDGAADFIPYRDVGAGEDNKILGRSLSALAWLEEQTASGSASITIDLSQYPLFRHFKLFIDDLVPGTDATSLRMTVSTDGGSTFDSGAGAYAYNGLGETSALVTNIDNSATFIQLNSASATLGLNANEQFSCEMMIYAPADTGRNTRFQWLVAQYNATPHITVLTGVGQRLADQDTTHIQFTMSSGNIGSGRFTLYGIRA